MSTRGSLISGITGSLVLSGSIFTYSYAAIPALSVPLSTPPLARQQWRKIYSLGRAFSPPVALITAGSFGWAWMQTGETAYAVAAGLVVSIVPWTMLVMKRTNDSIENFGEHQAAEGGPDPVALKVLLDRWAMMNFGRALFPLAAGIVGLVAALP